MKNQTSSSRKKGGFFWWLLWIVIAAGSFVLSAIFWTWFVSTLFGEIRGPLLTIIWVSAVFGSWLLTMIPIIRSKERYWNRLSQQDETHVVWWIGWMALTIASFFASAGFWTWFFAREGGSIKNPGEAGIWVFAVFGTWIVALIPLIIVMYQKVDRAYEQARLRKDEKEGAQPKARSVYVDPSKRILPEPLIQKIRRCAPTLKQGGTTGHLMTAILKDGRRVENVFIANGREILGIYNYVEMPFEAREITDLEPADWEKVPAYSEESWLRLDGKW